MKNIFKILSIAKPLHGLMVSIILISIVGAAFEIVTPLLSGRILDEVVKQAGSESRETDELVRLLAISFAATIVFLIARSLTQRLGDHLAGKIRQLLTEIFYDKAFTLPQSYYDSEVSGKIVNQLNRGITTIQGFINTATNFIIPTFLQAIIVIGILGYYNLALGVLMVIIFPIYLAISSISTKRWGKKEEVKNVIEDQTRGRIQEAISNIKLVKGYTNEQKEFNIVSDNLTSINKIYRKQSNEFHIFDFSREFVLYLILFATSIIIFYNAFEGLITIGTVIVLIQLVDRARQPLFGMSFILGQIQMAESGSKEYFEILALDSKEDYKNDSSVELVKSPELEFKNVSFNYGENSKVFENISFKIKQNEMVALVGPSGAGKSTIVNLILKFYDPTSGDLFLNGKNYKEVSANFVRKNISLVFQENELFSSTIKENVAYGSEIDDTKVVDALKKANAWDFVSNLEKGIDTEVGERGVRLSGGQRQRIQIARAIYKDAPILILDEATSSLDAKSESEVSEAIDNLVKDRLVIIIAHRFSTIQNANKVIVLNDKRVEEVGTPQELSAKPGIYSELLQYQIEGNKKLLKKFEIY
ncbi:MAG: ABC transporter ATP-binding protein [Ignavibacteriaceae bacterium]|nr:ABC transporter ATP-binding protein [Ignavibacteriaceae bacterium]